MVLLRCCDGGYAQKPRVRGRERHRCQQAGHARCLRSHRPEVSRRWPDACLLCWARASESERSVTLNRVVRRTPFTFRRPSIMQNALHSQYRRRHQRWFAKPQPMSEMGHFLPSPRRGATENSRQKRKWVNRVEPVRPGRRKHQIGARLHQGEALPACARIRPAISEASRHSAIQVTEARAVEPDRGPASNCENLRGSAAVAIAGAT
jgi:hypothetical protein